MRNITNRKSMKIPLSLIPVSCSELPRSCSHEIIAGLMLQSSFSVLSFVPVLWPEFSRWHLYAGILHYQMNAPAVQVRCVPLFLIRSVYTQPPVVKQEAFEKCLAHSPLRAATRPFTRCRYCSMHASMSTTTRDRGDRYGPIEWAQ